MLICIKMYFVPFGHIRFVLPIHKLCQQRLRALFVNRCKLSFLRMGCCKVCIRTQTFPLYVRMFYYCHKNLSRKHITLSSQHYRKKSSSCMKILHLLPKPIVEYRLSKCSKVSYTLLIASYLSFIRTIIVYLTIPC